MAETLTVCSASTAACCGSAFSEVRCNAMLLIGTGQTSLLRMCAWATYVSAFGRRLLPPLAFADSILAGRPLQTVASFNKACKHIAQPLL